MPNYCYYEMMIKGTKEHCYEWLKRMKDYNEPNHFYRMFDPINYEGAGDEYNYSMTLSGDCAWSLESCCRASGYSGGEDLFAVNTKELALDMEAYSSEPGMQFQEHYLYRHGVCEAEECVNCVAEYFDPYCYSSFEEFKKDMDLPEEISESDLDPEGYYYSGGFDWNFRI